MLCLNGQMYDYKTFKCHNDYLEYQNKIATYPDILTNLFTIVEIIPNKENALKDIAVVKVKVKSRDGKNEKRMKEIRGTVLQLVNAVLRNFACLTNPSALANWRGWNYSYNYGKKDLKNQYARGIYKANMPVWRRPLDTIASGYFDGSASNTASALEGFAMDNHSYRQEE